MKNKAAAETRANYERRVREAVAKKNAIILQAKKDFDAEVKAIHRELYG